MKKTFLFFLFAFLVSWNSLKAQTDYIICLDNGSTVTDARFKDMRLTAIKLIERLVACHPKNRYAVVHYGAGFNTGSSLGLIPRIYIESDFVNGSYPDPYVTRRLNYGQHFHEALGLIGNALDGSYNSEIVSPQTSLHQNPGSKLVVVVISDGSRNSGDLSTGSYLVNYYDTTMNAPGAFKNVTKFKVGRGAKFAMIHMSPNAQATAAAASIASAGGSYNGAVETNTDDPDNGMLPRLYYPRNYSFIFDSVSDMPNFDELVQNICSPSPEVGSLKFYYEFNCGTPSDFNIYGYFTIPAGSTVTNGKLVLRNINTGADYGVSTTPMISGNQIYFHFYPSDISVPTGSTDKYKFIMTVQYSTPGGGVEEAVSWNHYPFFPYDLDLAGTCTRGVPGPETGSLAMTPNPTEGAFTVMLNKEVTSGKLEILDLNGNIISTKTMKGKMFESDLRTQRQGIYIVKVTSDKNEIFTGKIIKK
ncbi:T9SS type A sorting domain-containing protein [Chryseobacterium lactis]|nr:T9SS type A sorting domain-containing protein [Chryseobacterium lactis]